MPDSPISGLTKALSIKPEDLFVLEQDSAAKAITGATLVSGLAHYLEGKGGISSISDDGMSDSISRHYTITFADGSTFGYYVKNGIGIKSIAKSGSSGLTDTYLITLDNNNTSNFTVSNGRGITSVSKVSTSGLTDTYSIRYNDNTNSTFTLTNGAKGDAEYVWIKYAENEPTRDSDMQSSPNNWIGICKSDSSAAPTSYTSYSWFKIKGETGNNSEIVSWSVSYQGSENGTSIPDGNWSTSVPYVPQAWYLWTKTETTYSNDTTVVSYTTSRMGVDGMGTVVSVNGAVPDSTGNVVWSPTAQDIGAVRNLSSVSGTIASADMTNTVRGNVVYNKVGNVVTVSVTVQPSSATSTFIPIAKLPLSCAPIITLDNSIVAATGAVGSIRFHKDGTIYINSNTAPLFVGVTVFGALDTYNS